MERKKAGARKMPLKTRSVRDWKPEDYGPGNERLSEQVDEVAYGD